MSKINLNYSWSKINELLAKIDSQNFNNYLLKTGGILNGIYSLGTNAYIANNSGVRILGHDGSNTTIGNTGGITKLEAANLDVKVSNGSSSYKVLTEADKGINIVPLDASGKISSQYLPSSGGGMVEVANTAALQTMTGEIGKIYVTSDNNLIYRWSGSKFTEIGKTDTGDILLLNENASGNYVSSSRIEFSGEKRYLGPFIIAVNSPVYGGSGRKDLRIYQRSKLTMPKDYSDHFVAMTIDAMGNVGIGNSDPVHKLEVNGDIKASSLIIGKYGAAVLPEYKDDGVVRVDGEVYINGGVHAMASYHDINYTTSDERLKDFEGDVDVDLEKINTLPKKYFKWKDHPERGRMLGTSAQALQEIYPELVTTRTDGMLAVNYEGLSVVALAAIDKLTEQNTELAEKNAELAEKNAELERRLAKIEKLLNIE